MAFKMLVVLVLVAILCFVNGEDYVQEEPCSRAGGQCLLKTDCSNSIPNQYLNLCPSQRHRGVECCHGTSLSETRCQKLGGECFSLGYCRDQFAIKRATNCNKDQMCCLLL